MLRRTIILFICLFAISLGVPGHTQNQSIAATNAAAPGLSPWQAVTDSDNNPVIETRLISNFSTTNGQQPITLAWKFKLQPHWHIYWKNPGDSGLPPELKPIINSKSTSPLPMVFPVPKVISIPPITNYGYEDAVTFTTNYSLSSNAQGPQTLAFKAEFLYCKDICLPGSATLELPLNVGPENRSNPAFKPQQQLPQPADGFSVQKTGRQILLTFPSNISTANATFIPADDGLIDDSAPQQANGNVLTLAVDSQNQTPLTQFGGLVLTPQGAHSFSVPFAAAPIPAPNFNQVSLLAAMGFALLAGLILNLMPCVLPVLSLKLLSLIKHHHGPARSRHIAAYTLGILASFSSFAVIIALLQHGGAQLGWGFHLQNPLIVAALTFVMLGVALNFFSVYQLGTRLTKLGAPVGKPGQESPLSSFATGALAVIVATPCTVPFMGSAMAFALTQNFIESLLVFLSLGLGMALPFLLTIPFPQLFRWLPRPGSWMLTFKHTLGWPMLLTALWLAWVFAQQTSVSSAFLLLFGATLLACSLWFYGLKPTLLRAALALIVACGSLFVVHQQLHQAAAQVSWQAWSPSAVLAAQQNNQPVFVDFTADWCLTCKVTEATVLNTASVQKLFADTNTQLLRGDWTKQDPAITAELAAHNRRGVPLYLLYLPGNPSPTILPQLLSYGVLSAALDPLAR